MDLKKQTIIHSLGNTVYLFGLWFLTVITTRILGYSSTGILTLAMAIGNVIATVQVFGVRGYQSSDVSFKYSPNSYLVFRILTIIAGCLISIIFCVCLGYPIQLQLSVLLFILIRSSETFSDVLFGNIQRMNHLEYAGISMLIRGLLLIVLYSVSMYVTGSLNWSMAISAIGGAAIALFIDIPLHKRTVGKSEKVSMSVLLSILKECFPLLITLLIPAVVAAFPRIILERYYGEELLGFYGNVSTPALLLTTVAPTILIALLPSYGNYIQVKDYKKIKTIWIKSIIAVVVFTIIAVVGVLLLGKIILSFVYTSEIIPYVNYLYYILAAMMFYVFTMCNNTVLVPLRKSWGLTFTAVISFIICIIMSVIVIKPLGIMGAILSLGIPYVIQSIIQIIWILNICKEK